ncbi:MAG: hypothetical protein LBJ48_05855 [Coriobacteriales bacterium]|jgi:hypothetical protein|nr:hypothetical protein [Coriobacteriales bacterium]
MRFQLTADEIRFIDAALAPWPFSIKESGDEEKLQAVARGLRVLLARDMIIPVPGEGEERLNFKPVGDFADFTEALKAVQRVDELKIFSKEMDDYVRLAAIVEAESEQYPLFSLTPTVFGLFEVEPQTPESRDSLIAAFKKNLGIEDDSEESRKKGFVKTTLKKP